LDIRRSVANAEPLFSGFIDTICHDKDIWNTQDESILEVRKHNLENYYAFRVRLMGKNWERMESRQAVYIGEMLDYLCSRKVKVVVVLLPLASWEQNLPFGRCYNKMINDLCENRHVELKDWSRMLDDEEFGDSSHPNAPGAEKLNKAFLELALPHLRATGLY
jgi:hypothetical protein